jgi:undecaprenyl-diphosphatase
MTLAWRSAAGFIALAALVAVGATRGIDLATTHAFQTLASSPLDLLVNWHTLLGQLAITLPAAALLAVVAWRRHGGWAWLAPLAILATGPIELVFKFGLVHPGPPEELTREFFNPLGVRVEAPSSFPSGHMARLTFLAVVVAGMFPSRLAWIAAGAFVAISLFARVYIGDHWISDAIGGLALGAGLAASAVAWGVASRRAARSERPEPDEE